jgi:hypothetical protein
LRLLLSPPPTSAINLFSVVPLTKAERESLRDLAGL